MASIIVTNTTANPLPIRNLTAENQQLAPGIPVDLTAYNKVYEIQADKELQAYIVAGDVTVNDGVRDLGIDEAINVAAPVVSTASIYNYQDAPEKVKVVGGDTLLFEDSEDNFKKKRVKSENIIFLGAGTLVYSPIRIVETGITYTKSEEPLILYGMEMLVEETGNYEVEFNGQFAARKSAEVVLIAIYIDDEMVIDTRRIIEADSFVAGLTDATLENVQAGQIISLKWWTNRGRPVLAEARSFKVRQYV